MTLDEVNRLLDRVRVRLKNNRLYLRSTLPPKPGHTKTQQYELSTGCTPTEKGFKTVLGLAKQLESEILLERFAWENWIDVPACGNEKPIEQWIAEFTQDYWSRNEKTLNRADSFNNYYAYYFKYLPPDEPLTEEVLRRVLLRYPPNSKGREVAYVTFTALAKFAGVPCDLLRYRGHYKAGDRRIPSDQEIIDTRNGTTNTAYRWLVGIIAAYGLRPHEVFHLNLDNLETYPHILRVASNTKTGARIVYPVPAGWVTDWRLWERDMPRFTSLENKSNRQLGMKISLIFHRSFPFETYSLRDRYAIRCAEHGIDATITSRWMGHSVSVHSAHYLRHIEELSMTTIWERAQSH